MSKAFTKDEPSDEPVIVPERPPLPPGVPNYVTDRGLKMLEDERRQLLEQRTALATADEDDASDGRKQLRVVNHRLRDLTDRISTARKVMPPERPDSTVRFGATVTLKTVASDDDMGDLRRIKLVGVDEASESASLVSFTAPIARAILGHRPGDRVTRATSGGEEVLEIVDVGYEAASSPPGS
jgi:transcription elongation factor GreB